MADKKVERIVSPEDDRPVTPFTPSQPVNARKDSNSSIPKNQPQDTKADLLEKFKAREERIRREEQNGDDAQAEAAPEEPTTTEGSME